MTTAPCLRARCSSASRASPATATISPPTRSTGAPLRWSSSGRWTWASPRSGSPRVREAMAPGRRRVLRRSDGRARGRRRHRHQRQDHDRLPDARRCSRPPGARPGCSGPSRASIGGERARGAAHHPGGDRPAAHVPGDARRGRPAPARSRSPRTRSSCIVPMRSTLRLRSSRTSPRTTSTSTRRWRTTSRPSSGCSKPSRGWRWSTSMTPTGRGWRRRSRDR